MKRYSKLKTVFILGALLDAAIAITWFMIASGVQIPNILSGYLGAGTDYRFAMFVAAMFMLSWSVILAWGSCKPLERRGLLIIAAVFLCLSIVFELMFFGTKLGGNWFVFGVIKRILISTLFTAACFMSWHRQYAMNS